MIIFERARPLGNVEFLGCDSMKRFLIACAIFFNCSIAVAQWQVPLNTIPIGRGPGVTGFNSVANTGTGTLCLLNSTPPSFGLCLLSGPAGGDLTGLYPNPTLVAIISAGGTGSATTTPILTWDAKGRILTASSVTVTPAVGSITGLGTGVATALATNVATAGAFITNGGTLGTPANGNAANLTGLPISTGITGLGTGVATALSVNVGTVGSFIVNGAAQTIPGLNVTGTFTANALTIPKGLLYNNGGFLGNLATGNNGLLVTDGSGNPSITSTLPSGLTLNSPAINSPAINAGFANFTGGLNYILSQNTGTAIVVSNVNVGTSALAVHTATNANGSASFGVGGANFVTIPVLQNKAYVSSQSALDGVVINTEGADAIVFSIANAEIGRFTSLGGFNLTPLFQAGNPANATSFWQISNPLGGSVGVWNGVQISMGTPIPAADQFGGNSGSFLLQQAVVGTVSIPVGDTTTGQAAGVAGYAITNVAAGGPGANPVGVYAQGVLGVTGGSVFGSNSVARNTNGGGSVTGFDANQMATAEFDIEVWKKSGGSNSVIGQAFGTIVAGGGNTTVTPAFSYGHFVNELSVTAHTPWNFGFGTYIGAAVHAFVAGPLHSGANQISQTYSAQYTNGAGTAVTVDILYVDSTGSVQLAGGVSCSGALTGAAVVTNGIVTHC